MNPALVSKLARLNATVISKEKRCLYREDPHLTRSFVLLESLINFSSNWVHKSRITAPTCSEPLRISVVSRIKFFPRRIAVRSGSILMTAVSVPYTSAIGTWWCPMVGLGVSMSRPMVTHFSTVCVAISPMGQHSSFPTTHLELSQGIVSTDEVGTKAPDNCVIWILIQK